MMAPNDDTGLLYPTLDHAANSSPCPSCSPSLGVVLALCVYVCVQKWVDLTFVIHFVPSPCLQPVKSGTR